MIDEKKCSDVQVSRSMRMMTKLWFSLFSIVVSLVLIVLYLDEYQVNQGYPSLFKKKVYISFQARDQSEAEAVPFPSPVPTVEPTRPPVKPVVIPHIDSNNNRGAIIIDDMGLDITRAQDFLAIDAPLAFSILPTLPHSRKTADLVYNHGRVVMVHIPMETIDEANMKQSLPWLLVGMNVTIIESILDAMLAEIPHARGANNHTGSRFTTDRSSMRHVLSYLKSKDMFFIDSRTTTETVAFELAQSMGIPSAERKVFFDDNDDETMIRHEFERFTQTILKNGPAIGIGHPKPATLSILQEYVPIFARNGITIVPITEMLSPQWQSNQLALKR